MPIIVSSHITASGHITGSVTSTGSFGRLIASTFSGDGSGLSSVTAGSVTWANISSKPTVVSASAQIKDEISGSFIEASSSFSTRIKANEDIVKGKTILSQSAQIKTEISGAFTTTSSSLAGRISTNEGYLNQSVKTTASPTFASLTTTGDITAQNYIVSSSVTYMTSSFSSGSTIFGDDSDDTHKFTGSLLVTGSFKVASGNAEFVGNVSGSSTSTGSFSSLVVADKVQGNLTATGTVQAEHLYTTDDLQVDDNITLASGGIISGSTFIYSNKGVYGKSSGAGAGIIEVESVTLDHLVGYRGGTMTSRIGWAPTYGFFEAYKDGASKLLLHSNGESRFLGGGVTVSTYVSSSTIVADSHITASGNIEVAGNISGSSTSTGSFGRIETAGNINADGRIYENNSSVIDHATAMAIVFGG